MARGRPDLRVVENVAETPAPPEGRVSEAEAELLAHVRDGDPTCVAAFYDRVRPQVHRTLHRLLGERDNDYADLAQIALIELVTTIGRYRGECVLDSWVWTVTARVVYRHLRRRVAERQLFDHVVAPDDLGADPARLAREEGARDLLRRISVHLAKLDERQSWVFVLHDVFGCDLREVAQIMGISAAAAQSRLVRGRKQLHERIAADPELKPQLLRFEKMPFT